MHPARLVPAVNFTAVYNVLNLPVGSVPVTKYNHEDEVCNHISKENHQQYAQLLVKNRYNYS